MFSLWGFKPYIQKFEILLVTNWTKWNKNCKVLHQNTNQRKILWTQSTMCYSSVRTGTWHSQCVNATLVTWWHKPDTKKKTTALKYSPSRGLPAGYSAPTPSYTSTTQHVCALIFFSLSATYVHSPSQLLPNYPHNTYERQCAEREKTSDNLTWKPEVYSEECLKKYTRELVCQNQKQQW